MIAETMAQCLVQQVGRRVVGAHARAALVIDMEFDHIANLQRLARNLAGMDMQRAQLLHRVVDLDDAAAGCAQHAGIAGLATAFGIERGLVDDDLDLVPRLRRLDLLAADDDGLDAALCHLGVVAEEFGGPLLVADLEPDGVGRGLAGACPVLARLGLLPRHGSVEAGRVDGAVQRAQGVLRQVQREAIGVVQLERHLARQGGGGRQPGHFLIQQLQAAFQRLLEAGLLQLQGFLDQALGARQLRVSETHLADERRHEAPHQRLLAAHQFGMAHGAAHDPAQHVAAPLVRRQYAVGDEETA